MTIPGTPEGVEVVRIGIANPDEFEIMNDSAGKPCIIKGTRAGTLTQIIVKPAEGWAFQFDARVYHYVPVKVFKPMEISANVKFTVNNSIEQEAVEGGLERLKSLPGYTEV